MSISTLTGLRLTRWLLIVCVSLTFSAVGVSPAGAVTGDGCPPRALCADADDEEPDSDADTANSTDTDTSSGNSDASTDTETGPRPAPPKTFIHEGQTKHTYCQRCHESGDPHTR